MTAQEKLRTCSYAISVHSRGAASRHWAGVLGRVGGETRLFSSSLGARRHRAAEQLVVCASQLEHLAFCARLDEEGARFRRMDLVPTVLRWSVPPRAPSHLAVTVDTLASASIRQTVLLINPLGETPGLFERFADAKRDGARIMTPHRDHSDLATDLTHSGLRQIVVLAAAACHVTAQRRSNALRCARDGTVCPAPMPPSLGIRRPATSSFPPSLQAAR